jgi:hypothetical protein
MNGNASPQLLDLQELLFHIDLFFKKIENKNKD